MLAELWSAVMAIFSLCVKYLGRTIRRLVTVFGLSHYLVTVITSRKSRLAARNFARPSTMDQFRKTSMRMAMARLSFIFIVAGQMMVRLNLVLAVLVKSILLFSFLQPVGPQLLAVRLALLPSLVLRKLWMAKSFTTPRTLTQRQLSPTM